MRRRGLATVLILMLEVVALGARAQVAGSWQVTEFDPLMPENPFFGQFRYRLEVEQVEDRLRLSIPRTGAVFAPATLDGDRLIAEGRDPDRGPVRIELKFAADRLEGTIHYPSSSRRVEGQLDQEIRLQAIARALGTARESAARAQGESSDLAAQRDALADRTGRLERALAEAERARQATEDELAAARKRIAVLERSLARASVETRPAPAIRPAPASAPQRPASPVMAPAAGATLALRLIEPPVDGEPPDTVVTFDVPTTRLVGRVIAPAGLLSLRVNGGEVRPDAQGLFTTPVDVGPAGSPVRIVAIDRNGGRVAMTFELRPAGPAAAAVPGDPARRCYELAIAAAKPDATALESCRAATREQPERALNHYNLGVALSRLGRHGEALRAYQEAAGLWAR